MIFCSTMHKFGRCCPEGLRLRFSVSICALRSAHMKDPSPSQGARKASKANSREVFTSEATKGRRGERTYRHTMCTWTDSGAGQTTWLGSRFICASVPLAVSPSLFLSHSLPVCHSISMSQSVHLSVSLNSIRG